MPDYGFAVVTSDSKHIPRILQGNGFRNDTTKAHSMAKITYMTTEKKKNNQLAFLDIETMGINPYIKSTFRPIPTIHIG